MKIIIIAFLLIASPLGGLVLPALADTDCTPHGIGGQNCYNNDTGVDSSCTSDGAGGYNCDDD